MSAKRLGKILYPELTHWDRYKAMELMEEDAKNLPVDAIQTTAQGKAWKRTRYNYHLKQIAKERRKNLKEMMEGGE